MKYLCHIRYVGTHFHGFQTQKSKRTVQSTLTDALTRYFGSPLSVTGCSRTDSGVHADGFAVTVALPNGEIPVPPERLPQAIAPFLPPDLSLYDAMAVEDGFHPRYDALGKEYRYTILHTRIQNPFYEARAWQVYFPFLPDALARMNLAASYLVGKHDFSAFCDEGTPHKTTVRTVFSCSVLKEEDIFTVVVRGDGFLYHMVRIIVGTLVAVATGRLTPEQVKAALASGNRSAVGATAPADGLCLKEVFYDEKDFFKKTRD